MNPVSSTQRYQTSSPNISSQSTNPGFFKQVESCLSWLFGASTPKQPEQQRLLERVSENLEITNPSLKSDPKIKNAVDRSLVFLQKDGTYIAHKDCMETTEHDNNSTDVPITKKIALNDEQYDEFVLKFTKSLESKKMKKEPFPTVAPKMIKPKEEEMIQPKEEAQITPNVTEIEDFLDGPELAKIFGGETDASGMKELLTPYIGKNVYLGGWLDYTDAEISVLHDIMKKNKNSGKFFIVECSHQDLIALVQSFEKDIFNISYTERLDNQEILYRCFLTYKQ